MPTLNNAICGACLKKTPPFQSTLAACRYAFPIDRIVQNFKYGQNLVLTKLLASLLYDAYQTKRHHATPIALPMAFMAMPLARTRQIERGFNQSQEIARNLAKKLRIPLLDGLLSRIKDAPKQATLPWRKRHQNVRQAFSCIASLSGQHIALVDDVMTSGATAHAAAQVLLKSGANRVDIWVVARATVNHSVNQY